MKKITEFTAVFSLAILSLFSCNKENSMDYSTGNIQSNSNTEKMGGIPPKIRVKFKHTAVPTTEVPVPPACEQPLGLCVIFGSKYIDNNYIFTKSERLESIGSISLFIIDKTHIKLIPDMQFVDASNKLELTSDMIIDPLAATHLGLSNLTIKKGAYNVNSKEGTFGSVIVEIY